jgi:UDP-2,3-diacylglucosamine pyrophosphatase LpxH
MLVTGDLGCRASWLDDILETSAWVAEPRPGRRMNDHDNYTELYVVSDLHLGGATNRQIFDQSEELAWLIDYVARREAPSSGPIGLVLNGDVVDFLAEEDAKDFDPEHAPAKLRRIMHAPEFARVFDALRRLLDAPGHRLMITLGNHDVELALPATKA